MPDDKRRDEATFRRDFEAARPRLLGALYEAVSVALRNVATTRLPVLPRMADAAQWATAAASGLGLRPGLVLAAFLEKRQSGVEESVQSDPVAAAVFDLASAGPWEGTVTELLECLEDRLPQATTLNHSVSSRRSPSGEFHERVVATLKDVTGRPEGV